jgi:hypothetical protein
MVTNDVMTVYFINHSSQINVMMCILTPLFVVLFVVSILLGTDTQDEEL